MSSDTACSCSRRVNNVHAPASIHGRQRGRRRGLHVHVQASAAVVDSRRGPPVVVLTREEGKNDKLQAALAPHGLECFEMPLIHHSEGADRKRLPDVLRIQTFDWITVTSPEAATVFLEAWQEAGQPLVRVAVVGAGTGEVLQQAGMAPEYISSKATGKTLGGELPKVQGGNGRVLYPASSKASPELQATLEANGWKVLRLDSYNTEGVIEVEARLLQRARDADVITFASPSAVKSWVRLVGLPTAAAKVYACIGATSARASEAAGLMRIHYPQSPGIEGWAQSVLVACAEATGRGQPKEPSLPEKAAAAVATAFVK